MSWSVDDEEMVLRIFKRRSWILTVEDVAGFSTVMRRALGWGQHSMVRKDF